MVNNSTNINKTNNQIILKHWTHVYCVTNQNTLLVLTTRSKWFNLKHKNELCCMLILGTVLMSLSLMSRSQKNKDHVYCLSRRIWKRVNCKLALQDAIIVQYIRNIKWTKITILDNFIFFKFHICNWFLIFFFYGV